MLGHVKTIFVNLAMISKLNAIKKGKKATCLLSLLNIKTLIV